MIARLASIALLSIGCMIPPASQRASDAARELNVAARFGRLDIAAELTAESARSAFLKSRTRWGRDVRVLDVEMAEFSMSGGERAHVEVDYAWSRVDEGTLRITRVSQEWRDSGGGFRMVAERRISGDVGLLGEPLPEAAPARPRGDVQFETKVIR